MFLLPTSAIDLDESENRVWNASLDGRAIHSFLQWIEPHLGGTAHPAGPPADASPPTGRALSALALAPSDRRAAFLRLEDGPEVAVLEARPAAAPGDGSSSAGADRPTLTPAAPGLRRATAEAVTVLERTRLRHVLELAVGAVVFAEDARPDVASELAWLTGRPEDPVELAEALLREGAHAWIDQWLRAEGVVGVRDAPLPAEDRYWLGSLLADCFAHQLHDRIAHHGLRAGDTSRLTAERLHAQLLTLRDAVPERLGRTTGISVVSELIGFMYPCWHRRQFATKSPFDYVRALRPLTEEEKAAHLAKWSAAQAVR
ncbi:hypothetical protein [Streptomyces sp. NPDC054863]